MNEIERKKHTAHASSYFIKIDKWQFIIWLFVALFVTVADGGRGGGVCDLLLVKFILVGVLPAAGHLIFTILPDGLGMNTGKLASCIKYGATPVSASCCEMGSLASSLSWFSVVVADESSLKIWRKRRIKMNPLNSFAKKINLPKSMWMFQNLNQCCYYSLRNFRG